MEVRESQTQLIKTTRRATFLYSALILCCVQLIISSEVSAHGTPAIFEVLSLSGAAATGLDIGDPARPDIVRTSIGLIFSKDGGSYRPSCPSQWGDLPEAPAAATPNRSSVAVIAGGKVFLSQDDACLFKSAPGREGAFVYEIFSWREQLWTFGRQFVESTDEGILFRITEEGSLTETYRWPSIDGERGFSADKAMVWDNGEGNSGLLLSGASPSPALWIGTEAHPDSFGLNWRSISLPDIGAVKLSLRGVSESGEVWLEAMNNKGKLNLWHGVPDLTFPKTEGFAGERPLVWSTGAPIYRETYGPILFDGRWIVVQDGLLFERMAWSEENPESAWVEGPFVDWTCLQEFAGISYACSLTSLQEIERLDADLTPHTRKVLTIEQLGPPVEGCPSTASEIFICEEDWLHYGEENGLLNREPSTSPDESAIRTEPPDTDTEVEPSDVETSAETDDGASPDEPSCGCNTLNTPPSEPRGGLVLSLLLFGWLFWRRKDQKA